MAKDTKNAQQDKRIEQRAAALRENLKRRKTQQQERVQNDSTDDSTNDGTDEQQK